MLHNGIFIRYIMLTNAILCHIINSFKITGGNYMKINFKQKQENEDLINYPAVHDYFEDQSEYENEYSEEFSIELFSFKLTFSKRV